MTDPYTIVLWCADRSRFLSMVGSHLLSEGLAVANRGRIENRVPVAIGVANSRRWPIFSREVSASGIIRSRTPRVATPQRHDYLLTFASGRHVDNGGAPPQARDSRVIPIHDLLSTVETISPRPTQLRRDEVVGLFDRASYDAVPADSNHGSGESTVHDVAELCQRLVSALAL